MASICPATVIVAKNALDRLDSILDPYRHVVCVSDEVIHGEYGVRLEGVVKRGLKWLMASDYKDGALARDEGDVILGFGGGRSLDVAKLLAVELGCDWVSIPTAASHDGIASDVASVSQDGYKYSRKCKRPVAVVADLSIMSRAPPRLKLAGTGDVLCKSSSLAEWRLGKENNGEYFDESAYRVVESALASVMRNDSLEVLVKAEIDAGRAMCMVGSSRPCSGTEHAISHAMDRHSQELHGLQVAFATPLCLYHLNQAGHTKHRADNLLRIMRKRGLPSSLAEMKLAADVFIDDIHHALEIMEKRKRYSVLRGIDDSGLSETIATLY